MVHPHSVNVRREAFASDNVAHAHHYLAGAFVAHRCQFELDDPERAEVRVETVGVGPLAAYHVHFTAMTYRCDPLEPTDYLLAWYLTSGGYQVRQGDEEVRAVPGDVGILRPGVPSMDTNDDSSHLVLRLTADSLVSAARGELGLPPDEQLTFTSMRPVNTELAEHWKAVARFVSEQLHRLPDQASRLVVEQLTQLAAHTALSTFPNNTMTMGYLPGPGRYPSAAIRRAMQYMDEHAAEPLTLQQIASVAGITPRALQAGFARLGVTPMRYLRRVRLEYAHRDLMAADPARGDTVTEIAVRWGFLHPGRFTQEYVRAHHERPSQTLRG